MAETESILTLREARKALNIKDANDERDALISEFLAGVDTAVEGHLNDWVVRRQVTIDVPTSGLLPGRNVISIVSARQHADGTAIATDGLRVTRAGIMTGGQNLGAWEVTLEVGLDEIPAAIKRGAAEILIQAWETQRGGDAAPGAFLVPYRAAAWLDPLALTGEGSFA